MTVLQSMASWTRRSIAYFVLCILLPGLVISSEDSHFVDSTDITIDLKSDAPALVGAPVGFYAQLHGANVGNSTFDYMWECKALRFAQTIANQTSNCTLITSLSDDEGDYEMKLYVMSGKTRLAKALVRFTLTKYLIGSLTVTQNGISSRNSKIVSTKTEANVSYSLYDPHHFLNGSFIFYAWSINGQPPDVHEASFLYNFSNPNINYNVMLVVSAISPSVIMRSYYTNSYNLALRARDPIENFNLTGKTSIQHGDLLELEVSCEGSTPFSYCWHFTQSDVNASTEKCIDPTMTTSCDIIIIRYFPKSGNYKLVFVIDNDISHVANVYNVNVFASAPEPQLSPIIVPLSCSCLVLLIIFIGIMYYIQTRRQYTIEVADFDFQQSDYYEFRTFFERLIDSCKDFCGNGQQVHNKTFAYRRIPAQIT